MEMYGYEFAREDDLNHHGILGQKWGKRNGPPYPLDAGDHSAAEKKAGWRKSLDAGEIHKQHHENVVSIKNSSASKAEKQRALAAEEEDYNKKLTEARLSAAQKEKVKKVVMAVGGVAVAAAVGYAVYKSGITKDDIKNAIGGTDTWLNNLQESGKFGNAHFDTDHKAGMDWAKKNLWSTDYWKNQLTEAERTAIRRYTGVAYRDMNKMLRMGSYPPGLSPMEKVKYAKYIQDCTSALKKASLPEDVIAHRGVGSLNSLAKTLGVDVSTLKDPAAAKSLLGQVFVDPAFGSTAESSDKAWGGAKLHMKLPKGCQALYVDPISSVPGENEILINRNARYKISDIRFGLDGQVKDVFVELIEHVV